MNKYELATIYPFEFCDGTTCNLTLSFARLRRLEGANPALFNRVMEIMARDCENIFEGLTVLYGAYVCANLDNGKKIISEEEFIERCGSDRKAVVDALKGLTTPKN